MIEEVDVVILSYTKDENYYNITKKAIDSLNESESNFKFNIHLVETNPNLLSEFPQGYGSANIIIPNVPFNYNKFLNIGLEKCKTDFIVMSNNDVVFNKDWFTNITSKMVECNAVSGSPYNDKLFVQPQNRIGRNGMRNRMMMRRMRNKRNLIPDVWEGYEVSKQVQGHCIVSKKSVLDNIKFDDRFEFFYQDNDYAKQLELFGFKHILVKKSVVEHIGKASHQLLNGTNTELESRMKIVFEEKWKNPIIQKYKITLSSTINNNKLEKVDDVFNVLTKLYNQNKKDFGVNMCASFETSKGISEAPRQISNSISYSNINLIKIEECKIRKNINNPYFFNLLNFNADQMPRISNGLGGDFFKNSYTIGFWFCELLKFPKEWEKSFDYIDELWVASDFCLDLFTAISPNKPATKIPVPISIPIINNVPDRKKYNISEDCFIFLFIFDCDSIFERKNPLAIIESLEKAFGKNNKNVKLIIKVSNLHSNHKNQLYSAVRNNESIILIDKVIEKNELVNLMDICNCYISLHRSEGYGLTLAEAMSLKKPCIATGYSGNLEFMNKENSYLVDYNLVTLDKDFSVYKKGSQWANPNIDTAVSFMRFVYSNRDEAKKMGIKAKKYIEDNFNYDVIGKKIDNRLRYIYKTI